MWAAGPNPRRQIPQVERYLASGQVTEAEKLLTPLLKSGPDQPRLLQLRAELIFLQGRYKEALEVAREAVRRGRTNLRAKALRNLIAATEEATRGFVSQRSPGGHFIIATPKGKEELLAPFAGRTLEAVREALRQSLGWAGNEAVRVEIYAGPEVLAKVSPLTLDEISRSGTIALSKYNRLMVVTPRALLRGYPWLDTLAHEYAHLVVTRLSQNNAPIWIHEGLAKYFEASWRQPAGTAPPLSPAQEHLLAEALRANQLITFEQMHPSMAKLPDQRATALAFAEVQTAIEFMASKGGTPSLRRLVEQLGTGKPEWVAVQLATGLERAEFAVAWRKHLRSLNLRRLPGLVPPELQFGKAPSKEQRLALVKESRARKLLRLAELLRTRGLTRAAIVEYQKARVLLGPRDDLVANHLARAYLEIASPAQAISALLPVLEYYPELPGAQTTMGAAYLRSGDLDAAAQHLRAALRLNPFDPEIHCGLAAALKTKASADAKLHGELCRKLAE